MKSDGLFNGVKAVISDFDGVFTDGGVYITEDVKETKKINYLDVMAIAILIRNGIKPFIVSGEKSGALEYLNEKFEKLEVYGGIRQKFDLVKTIIENGGFSREEVLYIGDDINDFDSICYCSHRATVKNAHPKIKSIPDIYITDAQGGSGAFREVVDKIPGILSQY